MPSFENSKPMVGKGWVWNLNSLRIYTFLWELASFRLRSVLMDKTERRALSGCSSLLTPSLKQSLSSRKEYKHTFTYSQELTSFSKMHLVLLEKSCPPPPRPHWGRGVGELKFCRRVASGGWAHLRTKHFQTNCKRKLGLVSSPTAFLFEFD